MPVMTKTVMKPEKMFGEVHHHQITFQPHHH
jgi:hypothetical protein